VIFFVLLVQAVLWFFYVRGLKNISKLMPRISLFQTPNYFMICCGLFLLILTLVPMVLDYSGVSDFAIVLQHDLV